MAERDGTLKLYNKGASSPLCTLASPSKQPFQQISWNPNTPEQVGGADSSKWYVWDWRGGKLLESASTQCEAAGFQWSLSHPNLFAVHSRSEVLLWDMNHLSVGCQQFTQPQPIQDVAWLGDEACAVIASAGALTFWRVQA